MHQIGLNKSDNEEMMQDVNLDNRTTSSNPYSYEQQNNDAVQRVYFKTYPRLPAVK